ncbi:hypothetical protein P8452_59678 [Trifolium repens]|nr:hypothetical protein QL285_036794 [Trifolium repens]WJX76237.1 hypothetical protein P8452_59678 [Trifolium repens]
MFSMKNVEAYCLGLCSTSWECHSPICICSPPVIPPFRGGICIPVSYKDAVKIVGKNLICQDDTECKNKETGNFCTRTSKPDMEYGVCADSIFEAQNLIFKIFSTSKLTKDNFWEIPT